MKVRRKMKRTVSIILISLIILMLFACSNDSSSPVKEPDENVLMLYSLLNEAAAKADSEMKAAAEISLNQGKNSLIGISLSDGTVFNETYTDKETNSTRQVTNVDFSITIDSLNALLGLPFINKGDIITVTSSLEPENGTYSKNSNMILDAALKITGADNTEKLTIDIDANENGSTGNVSGTISIKQSGTETAEFTISGNGGEAGGTGTMKFTCTNMEIEPLKDIIKENDTITVIQDFDPNADSPFIIKLNEKEINQETIMEILSPLMKEYSETFNQLVEVINKGVTASVSMNTEQNGISYETKEGDEIRIKNLSGKISASAEIEPGIIEDQENAANMINFSLSMRTGYSFESPFMGADSVSVEQTVSLSGGSSLMTISGGPLAGRYSLN